MSCMGNIVTHIANLDPDTIFATAVFLNYGTRNAVDQALFRLVKRGALCRVARGVFTLPSRKTEIFEVALCKANAFKKQIAMHGLDLARQMGFIADGHAVPTFVTSGATSSFFVGQQVVRFQGVSKKKMALPDNNAGNLLRALWAIDCEIPAPALTKAISDLTQKHRLQLLNSAHLIPGWLQTRISALFG